MKLLTKTTIYYLAMSLTLFAIGGVVFYFSLRDIINENIAENLEQTQEQVLNYVKRTGKLPAATTLGSDLLVFLPSDSEVKTEIKDTVHFSEYEEEALPYREIIFSVKTNDGTYTAFAGKPIIESDDIIESVATSLGIVAGILLIILFLLNWFLSKNLWKPFYKSLERLKSFDVSKKEAILFSSENILEFKLLNEALNKMTEKILNDYRNLKEFTENASHELQTPLAIIRSKLELMIQEENLSAGQMKQLQDIYESTNRLSKLNQSLLLLAKIENRQFHETQTLNLKDLVEKKLEQFEDMIAFKRITLDKNLIPIELKMNTQLADILLSNVIANAIRHNIHGGKLIIELKNNSFTVSNSGNPLEISTEKLFERFQKSSSSAESAGLGLSIVKQICDTYGFKIYYTYSNGAHIVSIHF